MVKFKPPRPTCAAFVQDDPFPVERILSSSPSGSWNEGLSLEKRIWTFMVQAYGSFFYRGLKIVWKIKQCVPGLAGPFDLDMWIVLQFFSAHMALVNRKHEKLAKEFTWLFWMCYFWFGTPANFAQNYGHVWFQHCPNWAISLFIDNGRHQFIPCDEDWTDRELLKHLISFYNAARFCGIPFETVGLRTVRRIEIAKLQDGLVVGKRQSVLHLGVSGPEGRPTFYFKHPNKLPGDAGFNFADTLKKRKVLAPKYSAERNCLNIIRTYRSSYVSLAVCIPTITSLIIGVVWTVVAAAVCGQDVQVSAQTAFTIGSYIVTAGSLLIALVVYLDGRFEASARDSQEVDDVDVPATVKLRKLPSAGPASAAAPDAVSGASRSVGDLDGTGRLGGVVGRHSAPGAPTGSAWSALSNVPGSGTSASLPTSFP